MDVQLVILMMSGSQRIYAEAYWAFLAGKSSESPEKPDEMSDKAAENIRLELTMYDTKSGYKLDLIC